MRITLLFTLLGLSITTVDAQLFETRTTRYSGDKILKKLNESGSAEQLKIRDSIVAARSSALTAFDTIETFYDDYHLGLVIYRNRTPLELIGFWDPQGNSVYGGELKNGWGTVKTPFNDSIVVNFENESVVYEAGVKNGPVFYYCDCASVLRRGTFKNNQKSGLWKEYSPSGKFIRQKKMKLVEETIEVDKELNDKKWLEPAHCMMRNPDEIHIECPKN